MISVIEIFYNTTSTFERLLNEFEDKLKLRTTIAFCLSGIVTSFRSFVKSDEGLFDLSFFENLTILSAFAFVGYFISRFIFTQLLFNIGKKLKGEAEFLDVRVVLAYSMIPGIILIPVKMFLQSHFSDVYFTSNIWILGNCLSLISIALSFKILVQGLRVYNRFSTGRALLNASPMILVPLLITGIFFLLLHL